MAEDTLNIHILSNKLTPPRVDRRWIPRSRLILRLNAGLKRRLTLISAPAGYGKTTLVVQWLDQVRRHSAWLSLDQNDSDPDRFLRYVIAAVRKVSPAFGSEIEPLLSSPKLPPPDYLADMVITELDALKKPLVIVLDDFHTIVSELLQMLITRLVQYQPDNLHLVIATRMDPPLPLAKWRIRDWIAEIRATDLRFFTEEAQAYFATPFAGKLSDDAIERILARTEGWVAGLQLARLSLAGADDPEASARKFSGSDRMVVEYLTDEVISRQPVNTQHFLAVTSMLDRFCAQLCDHLLAEGSSTQDSRRLIHSLETKNLFLVPLDADGVWYRYHHLFHTLIRERMRTALPQNRQAQIHCRAGQWYAARGYIDDALKHLIAAGDMEASAVLIEEHMHTLIDRDHTRRSLGRWLDLFPEGTEKQQPALLVAHNFLKIVRWDLAGMVPLLDEAESLLNEPGCAIPESRRKSLLGDIHAQRAICLYWQGDAEGALHHGRLGMELIPREHSYARTKAIVHAAGGYALAGRMDEGLKLLDQTLAIDAAEGSPNAGHLLQAKMAAHAYSANLDAVMEISEKILTVHQTARQPDYWLGYAHYYPGWVAYERNLLDAAADHFGRVEQMRYRVTTRLYHDALIGSVLVALAREDADGMEKYADMAYAFAIEVEDPLSVTMSNSIQVRRAIHSESVMVDLSLYPPAVESNLYWLETPSLTRAEYLVNRGNHRDRCKGLKIIEKGLQMARRHRNRRQVIQFLAVNAVALKSIGRQEQALDVLHEALGMAKPQAFVRSFVDRGPPMAELLGDLAAKRLENSYARFLLDAFGEAAPAETMAPPSEHYHASGKKPADKFLASGLSHRELDVLDLLEKRLTNKEIAERLFISPLTVKKHTANIYSKLNVSGRRQAVAAGKKMGILPTDNSSRP